jgi:hypothetical protein
LNDFGVSGDWISGNTRDPRFKGLANNGDALIKKKYHEIG